MARLADQRVLITAGGTGIGRAVGEACAAEGATIWVTDVDGTALGACPDDWRTTEVDAADDAGMAALFTDVEREWGGLDTLYANAGIAGPTAAVEDIEPDDFRRCMAVNLEGAFLASKHTAPMMKRQGSGSIVITSSTAGIGPLARRAPYVSAKWAMIGLMKTLALELGPFGIRANALCPGSVDRPRMDRVIADEAAARGAPTAEVRAGFEASSAMRTFVSVDDIAAMAVFLASPDSCRVSGQVIAVDGFTVNMDS